MSETRERFWLGPDHPTWPGAWSGGVDLRVDGQPVFAVHISSDIKRGWELVGPLDLDDPAQRSALGVWAESVLGRDGGYVHLTAAANLAEVALSDEEQEEDL